MKGAARLLLISVVLKQSPHGSWESTKYYWCPQAKYNKTGVHSDILVVHDAILLQSGLYS